MVTFASHNNKCNEFSNIKKASCIPPKRQIKTMDTETSILVNKQHNNTISKEEKKRLMFKITKMKKQHFNEEYEFQISKQMAYKNICNMAKSLSMEQSKQNNLIINKSLDLSKETIIASSKMAEANTELANANRELACATQNIALILKDLLNSQK